MEYLKETQLNPEAAIGIQKYCEKRHGKHKKPCRTCSYAITALDCDYSEHANCIFGNVPKTWKFKTKEKEA